ncbi:MAG: DUF2061 domain-containing protein [Candidatus Babeliales bacterium]
MKEIQLRSVIKSISWRLLGTVTLLVLSYFFTQSFIMATKISIIDIVSNIVMYFLHERVWNQVNWGRHSFLRFIFWEDFKRSITKAITWRILASIYLFFVIFLITNQAVVSMNLVIIDAILNIIQYYIHERIWNYITWGKKG